MISSNAAACLVLVGSVLAALTGEVRAGAFRGTNAVSLHSMQVQDLHTAVLDELMGALGHGNRVTEKRIQGIEESLRPMFSALPKNVHGNLDRPVVRYVLHRLFVLRHGMVIKGLEPDNQGGAGASPTEVLDDRVPAYVQSLMEERLGAHGFGLREVAILAATLEHLTHDEAVRVLKEAYTVHEVPLESPVRIRDAEDIIDTYMVMFLLGTRATQLKRMTTKELNSYITTVHPSWPQTQQFLREVQQSVLDREATDPAFARGFLTFNETSLLVEEIMERYGRWQDSECHDIKAELMTLEHDSTGRVPLKRFYDKARNGSWQFTESVSYLRMLGAMDEADPQRQSVIIPNYINAMSNCVASSSMYSICCLNECEQLLGRLERNVGAPDAVPERVLELVARLPSATVKAPRDISARLRDLLHEVAGHHNGQVPLHGRLFAQWLHYVYPRECPYPHKSGTTNPMTADEWVSSKGNTAHVNGAELDYFIEEDTSIFDFAGMEGFHDNSTLKPLMWTADEELVVATTPAPSQRSGVWSLVRGGAAVAALASLGTTLHAVCRAMLAAVGPPRKDVLPFSGKVHTC